MSEDVLGMRVVVFAVALLVFIGVISGIGFWHSAGVRIENQSCIWEQTLSAYLVSAEIENRSKAYKLADLKVQINLDPRQHQQWINGPMKARYSAMSKPAKIYLEPEQIKSFNDPFPVSGVEDFECRPNVTVTGQEKFEEPPGEEALRMLLNLTP